MRLYLYILASGVVATAVSIALQFLLGPPYGAIEAGGNILFVLLLGGLVFWKGAGLEGNPARAAAAAVGYIATVVVLGIAGALMFAHSQTVGFALMSLLSIGYYPGGPDAPAAVAGIGWSASMLLLIGLAAGAGAALRRRRLGEDAPDGR